MNGWRRSLTSMTKIIILAGGGKGERIDYKIISQMKEKEVVHKRYREEAEAAKMMVEEEKALKQLRRTLVPHARPVPSFDLPFLPQQYACIP
ncbi:hypothetical protein ACS0TY_015812 [Phlomoides rotata]